MRAVLLLLTLLAAGADAQVTWHSLSQTQCCPGSCPPMMPRYARPQRPQPDGEYTQPAPQFRPLPPPPQPTTPALPPQPEPAEPAPVQPSQPGFDWDAYDQRQAKLLEAIAANKCECKPTNLQPLQIQLAINTAAIAQLAKAIEHRHVQQPPPAPVASGVPAYWNIRPHKEK